MAAEKAIKIYFQHFQETLEAIIKSPTKEKYNKWSDNKSEYLHDVERPEDESKPSQKSVRGILDYIQQKMLDLPKYPSFKYEGYEMKLVVDVTEDMLLLFRGQLKEIPGIEEYASKLSHDYHLQCFAQGPSIPQCEYLDSVKRYTEVEKYWEEHMTADMMNQFMAALSTTNPLPRHEEENDEFEGKLCYAVKRIGPFKELKAEVLFKIPDETAEFMMLCAERSHNKIKGVSKYHYDRYKHIEDLVFGDEGHLYNKVSKETIWYNHLDRSKVILLKKDFGNRYSKDAFEYLTKRLLKQVRHGKPKENKSKQLECFKVLNMFFLEVNSKGTEDAKKAIEDASNYAEKYFGDQLALASSGGDPLEAVITATELLNEDNEGKFNDKYEDMFMKQVFPNISAEMTDQLLKFILAAIDAAFEHPLEWSCKIIDKRKVLDLMKRQDVANKILDALKDADSHCRYGRAYYLREIYESLTKALKSQKVMNLYEDKMIEIMKEGISKKNSYLHRFLMVPGESIRWDEKIPLAKEVLSLILKRLKEPIDEEDDDVQWAITATLLFMFRVINNTNVVSEITDDVAKIFHYCKDQDFDDPNGKDKKTTHFEVLKTIMEDYLMSSRDNPKIMGPMIEDVKELWECGDEIMERDANNIMTMLSGESAKLLGDTAGTLIDRYINENEKSVLSQFSDLYKQNPGLFYPRLADILDKMKGAEFYIQQSTVSLFWEIAKAEPDRITQEHVDVIAQHVNTENTKYMVMQFLQEVANKDPKIVDKHGNSIMKAIQADPTLGGMAGNILVALACIDEAHAVKYVKYIAEETPKIPQVQRFSMLYALKSIAVKHKDEVNKYRPMIEQQKEEAQLRDTCQYIIDVLEDRTLENLDKAVKDQEDDIDNLDKRVTETEENVDNIEQEVESTKKDVKKVKEDVNKVEGRVDDLEVTVEETVERVDDLEHRTLSHAPEWSHDVCKLMNPEADHDWRLLAQRLGYTNDDIRNWATQPDPCMSLLDEWFATHKTREATHAILKSLQEMNRTDAASIVEKALKAVEDIIKDQPKDYENPPPVFISYQWGHQQEVKLLKKHLKDAGFEGWMDIGQMGGGDKLYEKIDQGIRAAKVVVCCVSNKYASSPNCNREVALCVNLGKPIIPLLMEKMSWPPPGSMGPIFGEYLFIRFFTRTGEETGDQRFWSAAKFQELLMQLRYSVIPDDSLITKEYKNWWDPPEEEIVIKQRIEESKSTGAASGQKQESKDESSSPSVFISYQWGKQTQIKALYRRLTSLGYYCWLDINQMGGGDSLYDKIDKGVRGCKVVISCVTTKYSLSANCRREVSLADALKKPMIPLLLENMIWPPEGPMSMPFTQLLYINFCKPDTEVQNQWKVPQFDELLGKIKGYVPQVDFVIDKSAKKSSSGKDSEKKEPKAVVSGQRASVKKGSKKVSSSEQPKSSSAEVDKKKQSLSKSNKNSGAKTMAVKKDKSTKSKPTEPPKKETQNDSSKKKDESQSKTKESGKETAPSTGNAQSNFKPFPVTPSQKKSATCILI